MKKMRRLSVTPQSAPNSEINVTPLVDVVLVLLIIFMVVTPLLEKDIAVKVPETEKVETPSDVPPDQLVVQIEADGRLLVNTEPVAPENYVETLSTILETRSDKTVFISADDRAPYPALVHVLDGAKQAGAITLGMATEQPAK